MGFYTRGVLMLSLMGLFGCSPTYNWREVRVGGAGLTVLMPCKPEQAQRQVPLKGMQGTLDMASCDVGATTFAVSALALPDGMDPQEATQAWRTATLASIKSSPAQVREWTLPPRAGWSATGWESQGLRHDGQPVRLRVVSVGRGVVLHQMAVYGEVPAEALSAWLEGMQFRAAP